MEKSTATVNGTRFKWASLKCTSTLRTLQLRRAKRRKWRTLKKLRRGLRGMSIKTSKQKPQNVKFTTSNIEAIYEIEQPQATLIALAKRNVILCDEDWLGCHRHNIK